MNRLGKKVRVRAPLGGKVRLPGVGNVRAASGSIVTVQPGKLVRSKRPVKPVKPGPTRPKKPRKSKPQAKKAARGGNNMPRPKQIKKTRRSGSGGNAPMFSVAGQSGKGVVKGSRYRIEREPDVIEVKKPPKKPKVSYV